MLKQKIELLDKVSEYYKDEVAKNLKSKMSTIADIFKELIKNEAQNYNLVSENPIQKSIYVSLTKRVKGKQSFREKLIRKNLGLNLISNINLTDSNFSQKKSLIENEIEQFDDIIGLRYVCDLNKDCPQVLKMLKDNIPHLEERKIQFLPGEVQSQPQKMNNGLHIYRLKGVYDDRIGFELQIKSKIDTAWGDLDHFIFYKDYSFYPNKDVVQQTMNNVGKLLDKIEDLLHDLRNSKDTYDKSLERSKLLDNLEFTFGKSLQTLLGFPYQIEKLASITQYLLEKLEYNLFEPLEEIELNFDFLEITHQTKHDSYVQSRNYSFELQLVESIYSLIWAKKNEANLSSETYEDFLDSLINLLKKYNIEEIEKSNSLLDYDIEQLTADIDFLVINKADHGVWMVPKKYISFFPIHATVSDLINDLFESEIENEEINEGELQSIRGILLCEHFSGKTENALMLCKKEHTQSIFFKLKDTIKDKKSENKMYRTLGLYFESITNHFQ